MIKSKYKLHQRIVLNGLNARIIKVTKGNLQDLNCIYYDIRFFDTQEVVCYVKESELNKGF